MTTATQNRLVRSATAQWQGSLAQGEGWLSTGNQALAEARYSFPTRLAQAPGTFTAIAQQAKDTCLVSRLLNAAVSLDAVLLG